VVEGKECKMAAKQLKSLFTPTITKRIKIVLKIGKKKSSKSKRIAESTPPL